MLLIHSCWFSVGLILLVENCVALPHRQDRCHVGPAALTASLLLKVFQYFAFNTEGLKLISTISWTKGDRNSQRNDTGRELRNKGFQAFLKVLLTYVCS